MVYGAEIQCRNLYIRRASLWKHTRNFIFKPANEQDNCQHLPFGWNFHGILKVNYDEKVGI